MPVFDFVLAGRYKLIAPLGEGGMASVYRARDLRLNREVAVKLLHDDLTRDPEFLARFEREAQYLASLSHPNIVPVYDVGEEQGSHFIVMEYVRGRTLKDLIEATGCLPPERAVDALVPVLGALSYAHGKGLIHRDVKPHNILISFDGHARLADFGIAHLVGGSTTRTAAILGSAHYLSPEQARGEEATAASDVYACGIVLYEMLAGEPPFDGPNALAIAHHHLHSEPAPITGLDPQLVRTVRRALEKQPEKRFADAAEFSDALQATHPSTDATTVVRTDAAATDVLLPDTQSEDEQPADTPARARRERAPTPELVLHRSARKTAVLGLVCALAFAGVVYVAQGAAARSTTVPRYPSAPYAVVAAAVLAALAVSWINVRSWRYKMDGDAAVVQWGLLTHHRFGVPVRYITTLELKQSPIDRLLGVGTVELYARDHHGTERRLVMEDLPRPRQTYEQLMRMVGRAVRSRQPAIVQK